MNCFNKCWPKLQRKILVQDLLFYDIFYEERDWLARNQDNVSELGDMSIYPLNIEIGIYCFSSKHKGLRRKNKDCLARNQDNVSEWGNISIHELLFQ